MRYLRKVTPEIVAVNDFEIIDAVKRAYPKVNFNNSLLESLSVKA